MFGLQLSFKNLEGIAGFYGALLTTDIKKEDLKKWIVLIGNTIKTIAKDTMFAEKVVKIIGDEVMIYIPEPNIISFRSEAKRGGRWKNVDGYIIRWEKHDYFISFKPVFTTFEVKATLPKADGIGQAKSYLDFSHHVYLVFRYEKGAEELKNELKKNGVHDQDGVGIIFTADGTNFEILHKSTPKNQPSDKTVEEHLNLLLSETDKEKLLEVRHQYLVEQVLIPAISL